MRPILTFLLLAIATSAISLPQGSVTEDTAAAVLQMHELDRQAYMRGDAADLESRLADRIVVISEGNITTETKEAIYSHFVDGFRRMDDITWEDVERPVIGGSQDGMMAWGAFSVRSHYTEKQSDGTRTAVDATISWLSTYEKREGRWVVTTTATTRPSEVSKAE